jgi:ribonuclease P protein component
MKGKPKKGKSFMKHFNSIKKSRDFQEVYRTGKSFANKLLVMYVKKTDRPETRIGISVSRKVGNSVVRHHITRLIRESFRLHESMAETGLDIVVVVRTAAKEENYKTIESAYLHLCGLHNILKNESK